MDTEDPRVMGAPNVSSKSPGYQVKFRFCSMKFCDWMYFVFWPLKTDHLYTTYQTKYLNHQDSWLSLSMRNNAADHNCPGPSLGPRQSDQNKVSISVTRIYIATCSQSDKYKYEMLCPFHVMCNPYTTVKCSTLLVHSFKPQACVYTHTHKYTYIYTYMHTHTYTHTYLHIHIKFCLRMS